MAMMNGRLGVICRALAVLACPGLAPAREAKEIRPDGGLVHELPENDSEVRVVAADAACDRVVTGDERGRVRIWDGGTGALVREVGRFFGPALSVAVNADASRVVACGWAGSKGIDVNTGLEVGRPEPEPKAPPPGPTALPRAPSPRSISIRWDGTALKAWDGEGGPLRTLARNCHGPIFMAFGEDRERFLAVESDYRPRVWNIRTGESTSSSPGLPGKLGDIDGNFVAASRDISRFAALARREKTLFIHFEDLNRRTTRFILLQPTAHQQIALSPDGTMVAVVRNRGHRLILYTVDDGEHAFELVGGTKGLPTCVAFRRDGMAIATGDESGVVRTWDLIGKALMAEVLGPPHRVRLIHYDAKSLRCVSGGDERFLERDPATGRSKIDSAFVWSVPSADLGPAP